MSIKDSMAISTPARPTGIPIAERTVRAAKVAPPPTPATPKDAMAVTTTSLIRNAGALGNRAQRERIHGGGPGLAAS
jgi:hypothetical protein